MTEIPTLTDTQNKISIATHSPVDVFAPVPHPPSAIGDDARGWWPYQWDSVSNASTAARDQALSYLVDMGATKTYLSVDDLYARARNLEATHVLPRHPTVGHRSPITQLNDLISHFSAAAGQTDLVLPLPSRIDITTELMSMIEEIPRKQPLFALVGPIQSSTSEVADRISKAREVLGRNPSILLVDVVPSANLLEAFAESPTLVDGLIMPAEPVLPDTEEPPRSTTHTEFGDSILGSTVPRPVELAAVSSYVLSPLCESSSAADIAVQAGLPREQGDTVAVRPSSTTGSEEEQYS